jgi:hypothetical protein
MQDFVTVVTARQFSATLYEQLWKHGVIDRGDDVAVTGQLLHLMGVLRAKAAPAMREQQHRIPRPDG